MFGGAATLSPGQTQLPLFCALLVIASSTDTHSLAPQGFPQIMGIRCYVCVGACGATEFVMVGIGHGEMDGVADSVGRYRRWHGIGGW